MVEHPNQNERQNLEYDTLCRISGIAIQIPGSDPNQPCTYVTTGARTVIDRSTGKEYRLEIRPCVGNGAIGEVIAIFHNDVDVWIVIPGSERTKQGSIIMPHIFTDDQKTMFDQEMPPAREKIFSLLNFRTGNPDTVAAYCKDNDVFEILNEEYVSHLGEYLSARIAYLSKQQDSPIVILEAGAGDGKLTQFLQSQFKSRSLSNCRIIAVDNHSWNISAKSPVQSMCCKEALEHYHPKIVICSWMPPNTDWTADIRETKSVEEYILIGKPDSDMCGQFFATWGVGKNVSDKRIPPHQIDHFEKVYLPKLSVFQLCRFDLGDIRHSATVSFRRMNSTP